MPNQVWNTDQAQNTEEIRNTDPLRDANNDVFFGKRNIWNPCNPCSHWNPCNSCNSCNPFPPGNPGNPAVFDGSPADPGRLGNPCNPGDPCGPCGCSGADGNTDSNGNADANADSNGNGNFCNSCEALISLNNTFRSLWEQHVEWTRFFIVSTANCLADLPFVTQRLLRNPCDFANVLRQFYGPRNAEQFKQLFTEHLTIAAQLVNALKAGDTPAVYCLRNEWYQNAVQIAAFLACINPCWNQAEWQGLLFTHLSLTEQEATAYLNGQYEESIALYDRIEEEALMMADIMTQGIVCQFCFRFHTC